MTKNQVVPKDRFVESSPISKNSGGWNTACINTDKTSDKVHDLDVWLSENIVLDVNQNSH